MAGEQTTPARKDLKFTKGIQEYRREWEEWKVKDGGERYGGLEGCRRKVKNRRKGEK